MSNQVARKWQQVLDQLSSIANSGDVKVLEQFSGLLKQLDKQNYTAATWKSLIQDMQLPHKLGVLGCSLVADDPYKAGSGLPEALAGTLVLLSEHLYLSGIRADGHWQLKEHWPSVQQQMVDSGLISSLQHLMGATAQQLERCTAAAAAAPADDSGAALATAAAVPAAATSSSHAAACSTGVQATTRNLLEVYTSFHTICIDRHDIPSSAQCILSILGSAQAAAIHLMTAAMRHISVMLQQQQQQQDPHGNSLLSLAYWVASSTLIVANFIADFQKELGPQFLLSRGPHLLAWSDTTLVLVTYARVFQQQQQQKQSKQQRRSQLRLPDVSSMLGSPPFAESGTSKAHAEAATTASRSNSGSSSKQNRQLRARSAPVPTDLSVESEHALAAWQEVQGQWGRVPASHQQLLQVLGISPKAAVWLAGIVLRLPIPLQTLIDCWAWNPHNKAATAGSVDVPSTEASSSLKPVSSAESAVLQLQLQQQQWAKHPSHELLQQLLLYSAAYAAQGDDEFVCCCQEAFFYMLEQQCTAHMRTEQQLVQTLLAGSSSSSSSSSNTCVEAAKGMHTEQLLLTLQLLQRLQQLHDTSSTVTATGGGAGSSQQPTAAAVHPMFKSAADRAEGRSVAEAVGVQVLLNLAQQAQMQDPTHGAGVSTAASADAALQTGVSPMASFAGPQLDRASSSASGAVAAAPAANVISATAATGSQLNTSCSSTLAVLPTVRTVAGALFGVLECFLRAQGVSPLNGVKTALKIVSLCSSGPFNRPGLLLQLAQEGTSEQRVAFCNLLVTLLKLSVTPAFSGRSDAGSLCRILTARTAALVMMWLQSETNTAAATAAGLVGPKRPANTGGSSSSSSSSKDTATQLWLLPLLGRCCLQWAADLAQMQAEGADWVQVIRQARTWQTVGGVLAGPPVVARDQRSTTLSCFFESATQNPILLGIATSVKALLAEGSSISTGLTAAGYDTGAVLQGSEALVACYPGVLGAEGPSVVAGNVAGMITALEAIGRACSVFAVPHCCNNPGCCNLAGASELSIVSGKGCICGGCQVARYCGKGCQKAHWKQHKPVCKMLQAAATQHR